MRKCAAKQQARRPGLGYDGLITLKGCFFPGGQGMGDQLKALTDVMVCRVVPAVFYGSG